MKREIDRIAMGSLDIYMVAFSGNSIAGIPEDEAIETEENLIGRTKNGGTYAYNPEFYTAESDDGKAKRTDIVKETVTFDFGLITWNGDTIKKLVPTATTTFDGTARVTKIGGIDNDNGLTYLFRAVHKDKVKGDVRYTFIGKNVKGFSAAYKPREECTITPSVEAEPFDDGTLTIIRESDAIVIGGGLPDDDEDENE